MGGHTVKVVREKCGIREGEEIFEVVEYPQLRRYTSASVSAHVMNRNLANIVPAHVIHTFCNITV